MNELIADAYAAGDVDVDVHMSAQSPTDQRANQRGRGELAVAAS